MGGYQVGSFPPRWSQWNGKHRDSTRDFRRGRPLPVSEVVRRVMGSPDSDPVRQFLIDNALMWLREYHVDGLRIDSVHAMPDSSAVHFLEQLAGEAGRLGARTGAPRVLIAESNLNDPRVVRPSGLPLQKPERALQSGRDGCRPESWGEWL